MAGEMIKKATHNTDNSQEVREGVRSKEDEYLNGHKYCSGKWFRVWQRFFTYSHT